MRPFLLATLACATLALGQTTTSGKLGDAAITENNPTSVAYVATLPTGSSIQGMIEGVSNENGTGVNFNINFYQFPDASQGPFLYHIHVDPVQSSGSCASTLGHLDPYERGESPACDPTQPETCQVGDLSGKHGNITTTSTFQAGYLELYTTTQPGIGAFFGNRSVVIHSSNLTRLACANFELADGSPVPAAVNGSGSGNATASASSGTASASSTASGSTASASASANDGAVAKAVSGMAVVAALAVFVL